LLMGEGAAMKELLAKLWKGHIVDIG